MTASIEVLRALDELTRVSLQELRDSYFWWLVASSIIVAIGVVLEETEFLIPASRLRINAITGLPITRHRLIAWTKRFEKLGWILIVAGVAGEGVCEVLVSRADGLLQEFNTTLLASAQRQAADAIWEASNANERAAKNEKEAAQLRLESEKLTKDNLVLEAEVLKLREKMADRHLSADQRQRIRNKLRAFPGQSWNVIVYPNDPEAIGLANEIAQALIGDNGARWGRPNFWSQTTSAPVRGILVEFSVDANSATRSIAEALAEALRAERLDVLPVRPYTPNPGQSMATGNIDPRRPITITVGIKPPLEP